MTTEKNERRARQQARAAGNYKKREIRKARKRGELFEGDAQANLFANEGKPGVEFLDPSRPRPELDPPKE